MPELRIVEDKLVLHSDILSRAKDKLGEILGSEQKMIQNSIRTFTVENLSRHYAARQKSLYQAFQREQVVSLMQTILNETEIIEALNTDKKILTLHRNQVKQATIEERYNEAGDKKTASEILTRGRESNWPIGTQGKIKLMATEYIQKSIFQLESSLHSGYSRTQIHTCKAYIRVMKDELLSRGVK